MDITFTLTDQETNVVLDILGDAPFKKSMPLIQKIMEQAKKQVAAQQGAGPNGVILKDD